MVMVCYYTTEALTELQESIDSRVGWYLGGGNGSIRLWWLGYVAHQVAPAEPDRFLEVVLYRQDPRSALIERPSVSRNYRVLKAVFQVMKRDYDTKERALFVRDTFRVWMKGLNRKGGMLLLDALSDPQLERLVNDEAVAALSTHSGRV